VPLANQPRFTKKRIATTTTASITKASTIFANVKFSTSLAYSGNSIRSGCFLARSCSSARDLLEPLCLLFCNPSIHRRGVVAYEELLAAAVGSGLLWKLIPVAATHCIARSHRPFDFVWRFTVWTNGTLLYFSQSLGRPFDLDASFAGGTVDVLCHSVPLTPALIDDQSAATRSLRADPRDFNSGQVLIRCCYYKWPPSN
jgi:hypothetical protein